VPEALSEAAMADGLREAAGYAGFSRPVFGGRSAAEPGVAQTKVALTSQKLTAPTN